MCAGCVLVPVVFFPAPLLALATSLECLPLFARFSTFVVTPPPPPQFFPVACTRKKLLADTAPGYRKELRGKKSLDRAAHSALLHAFEDAGEEARISMLDAEEDPFAQVETDFFLSPHNGGGRPGRHAASPPGHHHRHHHKGFHHHGPPGHVEAGPHHQDGSGTTMFSVLADWIFGDSSSSDSLDSSSSDSSDSWDSSSPPEDVGDRRDVDPFMREGVDLDRLNVRVADSGLEDDALIYYQDDTTFEIVGELLPPGVNVVHHRGMPSPRHRQGRPFQRPVEHLETGRPQLIYLRDEPREPVHDVVLVNDRHPMMKPPHEQLDTGNLGGAVHHREHHHAGGDHIRFRNRLPEDYENRGAWFEDSFLTDEDGPDLAESILALFFFIGAFTLLLLPFFLLGRALKRMVRHTRGGDGAGDAPDGYRALSGEDRLAVGDGGGGGGGGGGVVDDDDAIVVTGTPVNPPPSIHL